MQTITAKAPRTNSQSLMAPSYFASTENPSARIYFQRLRDEGEGSPAISSSCPRFLISEGTIFLDLCFAWRVSTQRSMQFEGAFPVWQRLARKHSLQPPPPCRISELIAIAVRNTRTIFAAARMAYHKAGSGSHQFNSFTRDEVAR
jgi:hypothetical protein